ncbi:MAG: lipid-transfer protein [Deltaproteobacteria bacterium]|nr:lipid-transfer protein [Deltaproteobacteria bacterium]MBW2400592.1 lipid-transfer protein [Deltaproteobacteria bacterium]MBW2664700.1 lipid-transfer protein [Deltaproteobacteria bacterium]
MPTTLKNEAAIVGVGQTEYSKNSGRSEVQLACEATKAAIMDAGIAPSDVDGMVTFTLDTTDDIEIARAVGIGELTFFSRTPHGGGAAVGIVHQAAMAVATGAAKYVVCYRALNGRSGQRYSEGVSGNIVTSDLIHWSYYMPFGLMTPASWVALITQRYMHETGSKPEDLAQVCITQRDHAVKNPAAFFYQKPLSLDDYMNARMIVDPLRLYDCCQETDGASAVIVTTPERARDLDAGSAVIRGIAQGAGSEQEVMTSFYRDSISEIREMDVVARECYRVSGLGPDDIDAAIVYDAFSSIVLMQLESFGFCKTGEAKDFVQDGNVGLGGRLPINTHGGQLSEAYIHGVNGVIEGVRLIRGDSINQPPKSDHVLVTAGIGVPTSGMILGKPD